MTAILTRNDKLGEGHYTVIKELGVGGMGVVYQCRDEFLERDVAIKMLLPELVKNPKNLEVFKQEAKLAAQLEHPNIVTIYDIGLEKRDRDEHYFVAMEFLPGGNLGNQTAVGALPVEHAINWMKQLANGLYYAHKMNVVHQDIKADNIFINKDGDLKIGDFGLARLMENKVFINPSTKGMGTPAYMSPELCRGEQQDHRSDIYSLGVLFFEMATGQLPFKAEGMIEMAMKHTTAPIPSARRINPLIPSVIDKVIRKMMEKVPDDRFQSLEAVINVLDDLIFELRVKRMGLKYDANKEDSKELLALKEAEEKEKSFARDALAKQKSVKKDGPAGTGTNTGTGTGTNHSIVDTQNVSSGKKVMEPVSRGKAQNKSTQIPMADLKAAGIKLPKEVGPIREATVDVEKKLSDSITSHARMPAISKAGSGLEPVLKEKWVFNSGGPVGWRSSPVMGQGELAVFLGSADFCLYKLALGSGAEIWSHDTGAAIIASPVQKDDTVFVVNDAGLMTALNVETGEIRWQKDLEGGVVSTPVVAGDRIVAATKQGRICCLETKSGQGVWAYDSGAPVVSSPKHFSKELFFGTREKSVICLDFKSGHQKWKAYVDGAVVSTPAVSVDSLYVGTQEGAFYALDAESGQPLWEYYADKSIISSPIISFTSVIFTSLDKWLYCCEKYDGRLKWKSALRGRVQADLTTVDKNLVAVTREGWMQSFEMSSGKLNWQRNFDSRLESTPVFLRDGMLVATIDGKLTYYSFENAGGGGKDREDLPKSA